MFPCERSETGELFQIGDASNGLNAISAVRLTENFRLLADCGNCVAKRLCSICPAYITECTDTGKADATAFQENCKEMIKYLSVRLERYTYLMESNRDGIDMVWPKEPSDDWLLDINFTTPKEENIGIEELAKSI